MMEVVMKLIRILLHRRFACALGLSVILALSLGTAQATPLDPIDGSIIVSAFGTGLNGVDLPSSTQFTPLSPAPNTMFMFTGTGDLAIISDLTIATASGPLDINTPLPWAFSTPEGTWTTLTSNVDNSNVGDGYIDFFLIGMYTPNPAGSLSGFGPASGEMRISLNQTGPVVSWGGTMTMTGPVIPEPMTMSILGLGGLAILGRRRRK